MRTLQEEYEVAIAAAESAAYGVAASALGLRDDVETEDERARSLTEHDRLLDIYSAALTRMRQLGAAVDEAQERFEVMASRIWPGDYED